MSEEQRQHERDQVRVRMQRWRAKKKLEKSSSNKLTQVKVIPVMEGQEKVRKE